MAQNRKITLESLPKRKEKTTLRTASGTTCWTSAKTTCQIEFVGTRPRKDDIEERGDENKSKGSEEKVVGKYAKESINCAGLYVLEKGQKAIFWIKGVCRVNLKACPTLLFISPAFTK